MILALTWRPWYERGDMAWAIARRALGRDRELVLAAAFLGMAAWEVLEMWVIAPVRGPRLPLAVLVHATQVAIILVAVGLVLRLWREKTARELELARMVEKVVFAQEEERRRVAYDLHDGIAPLVVSAKQHLDTAQDVWPLDTARAVGQLDLADARLREAITEMRRILVALRPPALDAAGLSDALRRSLEESAREAGWSVEFTDAVGDVRIPAAVETAVFRIFQEALANARRHAATDGVRVDLRRDGGWLVLDVRDDGAGFAGAAGAAAARGLGLTSMRERARLLGGTCSVETAPGRGTRVCARLPIGEGSPGG
jgi:signal transduction histidine kinase